MEKLTVRRGGTTLKQLPANWWLPWLVRARTQLVEHRNLLNRINVFPVADADTGTNLVATVGRAADTAGLADEPDFATAARAALRGARGNSGTLVSVWLLGLAGELEGLDCPDVVQLHHALLAGAQRAQSALSQPAEGTALTVMSALAAVPPTENFGGYLAKLVDAAESAVRQSAHAEHARHGWVDSGALGMLLVTAALYSAITATEATADYSDLLVLPPAFEGKKLLDSEVAGARTQPQVEVMCTMQLPVYEVTALRSALDTIGDSVSIAQVYAGHEALWAIHVHVAKERDALRVLEAAGEPQDVRVTALDTAEHQERHAGELA